MAEVTIRLANGSTAQVAGSPEEVARVLQLAGFAPGDPPSAPRRERGKRSIERAARSRSGPRDQVLELKTAGFFRQQRTLSDIQRALEEVGRIYALDSLSPTVVRLVRDRELGRLRGASNRWTYVER